MSNVRVMLVKLDKPPGGPSRLSYSEPIGLCYIAAYLEEHGVDTRICHLFQASPSVALAQAVTDFQPDIIGFSVRNFNLAESRRCVAHVRSEWPHIRTVVGGECVTSQHFDELLHHIDADVFIFGDGECPMLALSCGVELRSIPGIAYKGNDGSYCISQLAGRNIPVARLPMMSRAGLPMDRYCSPGFPGKRYATLHALRGCRYRCTFCHTAGRYAQLNSRSVDQVLEEVDHITQTYGTEAMVIWDEDFYAVPERVRLIAEGLVSRGSPVAWHSFMKLTDLRRPVIQEMLPLLRKSGYVRAVIGLESFLPETLRRYHKAGGTNAEELALRLTDNGIALCPAYIIGAPHETRDDVEYGLERLLRLRDDHGILMDLPFIQFIMPYPGTALYDEYTMEGRIVDFDWSHYDGEHVVIRSACPPEELIELRDAFYGKFYGRQLCSPRKPRLSA